MIAVIPVQARDMFLMIGVMGGLEREGLRGWDFGVGGV